MTFPRYPQTKDSSVEWLGDVPNYWNICLAKRYLTVKSGDMISASEETDQGYPLIGGNGLRAYTHSTNAVGDTLVIGRVGAHCGCVHHIDDDFWASEHAFRVIEKQNLSKRYFYHLLTTINLNQFAIKTAQPLLNTEIIETQWIAVPPLREQRAIASFLDRETRKIDGLVAEQRRLIGLLKEKRQAVISHAVTRGLNPQAPTKPSNIEWLGDVPEHWETVAFQRCVSVAEGQIDPKLDDARNLILIAPNHIESGTGRLLFTETAEEQAAISGKYECKAGDVVYSKIRPSLRKVCFANYRCLCSADMYPLHTHSGLTGAYLLYWILSEHFSAFAVLESDRVAMPKINRESLKAVRILLPPEHEQVAISQYIEDQCSRIQALITQAESTITLLQERRSALISAAVTGKIDVRPSEGAD